MPRLTGAARVAVTSWKKQRLARRYPRKKRRSLQAHVAKSAAVRDKRADRRQPDCCDAACFMRGAPAAARASSGAVVRIDIRRGCRLRDRRSAGSGAEAAGIQCRTGLVQERVGRTTRCHCGRPGHRREYGAADDRMQSPRFATAATRVRQVRAVRCGRGQLDDSCQGAVSPGRDVDSDRCGEGNRDIPDKPFADRYQDGLRGGPVCQQGSAARESIPRPHPSIETALH